jgi:hypothetical protein
MILGSRSPTSVQSFLFNPLAVFGISISFLGQRPTSDKKLIKEIRRFPSTVNLSRTSHPATFLLSYQSFVDKVN